MALPEYVSSSASAYASGERPNDNAYEIDARNKAEELLTLWALSPQRASCHPDQRERPHLRAISEQPTISFAIFSAKKGEYELVRHKLHNGQFLIDKIDEGEVKEATDQS